MTYTSLRKSFVENILDRIAEIQKRKDVERFHHACLWGYYGEVYKFIESGIDINIRNESGQTPLMSSCLTSSNHDIVELLIQSGADINIKDIYGNTALDYARKAKDEKVINLLVNHEAK